MRQRGSSLDNNEDHIGQLRPIESQSEESGNRPQSLILLGEELWTEVRKFKVEYNINLCEFCTQCSICLADFHLRRKDENIPGDSVIQLGCNKQHIFHSECLKEWVKFNFTCPICREVVLSDKTDTRKLDRYKLIIRQNTLIALQNDEDNVEGRFYDQAN